MAKCDSVLSHCHCTLLADHDDYSPHLCKCGAMWDANMVVIAWPKPDAALGKRFSKRWPAPQPDALWRKDDELGYVKNEDGESAR